MSKDLVSKTLERISKICKRAGTVPEFNITTNGTLFDEQILEVFKKYNVSVVYDDKDQVAYVRTFGESIHQNKTGNYHAISKEKMLQELVEDPNAVDPLSGVLLSELRKNQEEMERQQADLAAVDPLSSIPLSDLRKNQAELERQKTDSAAVGPLSGIPTSDLVKNPYIATCFRSLESMVNQLFQTLKRKGCSARLIACCDLIFN